MAFKYRRTRPKQRDVFIYAHGAVISMEQRMSDLAWGRAGGAGLPKRRTSPSKMHENTG